MTENIPSSEISTLSFEEALKELETIVGKLENGQMKLQEAVDAYERGSALRKHCEKQLDAAESRLLVIGKKEDIPSEETKTSTEEF